MKSISMPTPRRFLAAPLGLALLGALAGCGPVNRGLESVHQPVVSRADYSIDVSTANSGLAAGEAQRLDGWFASLRLGYGDTITLDDPAPYGHPGSRDAVATVAAHYGLLLGNDTPVTPGEVPTGYVRVVVSRASARVDHCSSWDRKSQPELAASTTSNFGCAVNTNLAAMVANPQDLVRGQAGANGSVADGVIASKAISTWRTTAQTGKDGLPGGITSVELAKTGGGN